MSNRMNPERKETWIDFKWTIYTWSLIDLVNLTVFSIHFQPFHLQHGNSILRVLSDGETGRCNVQPAHSATRYIRSNWHACWRKTWSFCSDFLKKGKGTQTWGWVKKGISVHSGHLTPTATLITHSLWPHVTSSCCVMSWYQMSGCHYRMSHMSTNDQTVQYILLHPLIICRYVRQHVLFPENGSLRWSVLHPVTIEVLRLPFWCWVWCVNNGGGVRVYPIKLKKPFSKIGLRSGN